MYIDEKNDDWNDLHPWNAPPTGSDQVRNLQGELKPVAGVSPWWSADWGYNDWNKDENNVASNGKQVIVIKPWTHWNDNSSVSTAVAYGWGCWDGALDFNYYMTREAIIIADARVNTGGNDFYAGAVYASKAWVDDADHRTHAPGNNWFNYIFRGRKMSTSAGYNYYDYSVTLNAFPAGITAQYNYYPTDSFIPKPVVPGFSTWHAYCDNDQLRKLLPNSNPNQAGSYHYNQTASSSGVDCSGFVSQSANWNDRFNEKQGTVGLIEKSWLIQDQDLSIDPDLANPKYAVPGDILDWVDNDKNGNPTIGRHVVIILTITLDIYGNITKRGQI